MESSHVNFTVLIIVLLIYFIPLVVAVGRRHKNAVPIFIVNIFLGWTFIGWFGALVWAFTDNVEK